MLIESMECTNVSNDGGKCFFIVKKSNVSAASKFLDKELQLLYQRVVSHNLRLIRCLFHTKRTPRQPKQLAPMPLCSKDGQIRRRRRIPISTGILCVAGNMQQ
eukprot:5560372-Ditylum_brightwellii.AAC.1